MIKCTMCNDLFKISIGCQLYRGHNILLLVKTKGQISTNKVQYNINN